MVAASLLVAAGVGPASGAMRLEPTPRPEVAPEEAPTEPLTAPDAVTAATIARLEGVPVEVLGERTVTGSVFALPDGTMAAGAASGPVWVPVGGDGTAAEDWAPLDLTLRTEADGSVVAAAHPGHLVLSGGTPVDTPADAQVPVASMTTVDGGQSSIAWVGPLPEPRLDGARAVYEEVRPGVDMVVDATASGFEQFFVVREPLAEGTDLTLPVLVQSEGASVTEGEDGTVQVTDPAGQVVASSGEPTMWDAQADADRVHPVTEAWNPLTIEPLRTPPQEFLSSLSAPQTTPRRSRASTDTPPAVDESQPVRGLQAPAATVQVPVERALQARGTGELVMELAPQEEFLSAPDTRYPVVIDPDLDLNAGFDTFVQSGVSYDLSTSQDLLVGTWNGGATVARSIVNFNVSPAHGKEIIGARVYLYEYHAYSCTSARNWQIWNVPPADTSTRWSNQQPGAHFATSGEQKSASCGNEGWVSADATSLVATWVSRGWFVGGMGIRAENEADSYGWKRFYSSEVGVAPWIWVVYNTPPDQPTSLRVAPAQNGSANGSWVSSLTPTVSATISDPDGGVVNGIFEVVDANFQLIHKQDVNYLTSGSVASVTVPAGKLQDGGVYYFRVCTSDNRLGGRWSSWFNFGVDVTKPPAPTVGVQPFGTTWGTTAVGTEGTFTFTTTGDATVTGFRYGLDKAPDPANAPVPTTNGVGTLKLTPTTPGPHTIRVQTLDRAGNVSGEASSTFYVGMAGLRTPLEGATVVRRTRLTVEAPTTQRVVSFEYRRGPDTKTEEVPVRLLSTSTGTVWTTKWGSLPHGGFTSIDLGMLLGNDGGPVQVRAVTAPSTTAEAKDQHATQWVSVTVDPDADGAATTAIGPGSVNLLTGDYTLGATDVEQFGLSLVRTASSRDPKAGWQPLGERLALSQQQATSMSMIGPGTGTTTVDLTKAHSGTTSFKVMPYSATDHSYMGVGGDAGGMRLGMQAGKTYRISGWIYVPASTGLTPSNPNGRSLVLYYRTSAGYNDPYQTGTLTPRPTVVDVWQKVSIDVTIPKDATEAFVRMFNGSPAGTSTPVYFDDLSVRELHSPFGPQWAMGTTDANVGTAYTHITRPYPEVAAVHLTGGGEVWFTSADQVKWWPQTGAEDLTLTAVDASTWRLTELDGTVTEFALDTTTKNFTVRSSSLPAAQGATGAQTRYQYDGQNRLWRLIAPAEPGVDATSTTPCVTATTPAQGCEVMELTYATTTTAGAAAPGDVAGQVSLVSVWSWDPTAGAGKGAMVQTPITRYLYNTAGQLVEVYDQRIVDASGGSRLSTLYAYDAAGRVSRVTPSGEKAYDFTYGAVGSTTTGSGDLVDDDTGRLFTVSRDSLHTQNGAPLINTSRVVYKVPLTRTDGGPYDLGPEALKSWAQVDGPSDATAVFGPDAASVTSSTATATAPSATQYKTATVHYLDASGREVNTASPQGAAASEYGFIDTTEYDQFGNVIRILDATNRLQAMELLRIPLLDQAQKVRMSSEHSQNVDTRITYSADGLDVLTRLGPLQTLAVGNDPNETRTLRPRVTNIYDAGKPDGVNYHLVTSTIADGVEINTGNSFDPVRTEYGYNPIDGASPLGPTSGWIHKQPTRVVEDHGGANLTTTTTYDARGRVVLTVPPGSTPTGAAATVSVYYTAGAHPSTVTGDAECGNKPE